MFVVAVQESVFVTCNNNPVLKGQAGSQRIRNEPGAGCMYVRYHIKQEKDQTGKVANPVRGQLNRENEYFPAPVQVM